MDRETTCFIVTQRLELIEILSNIDKNLLDTADLSDYDLFDDHMTEVIRILCKPNCALKSLKISGTGSGLLKNTKYSPYELTDTILQALLDALSLNKSLEQISLINCGIVDKKIPMLIDALQKSSVRSLDLTGNPISEASFADLAECLDRVTELPSCVDLNNLGLKFGRMLRM